MRHHAFAAAVFVAAALSMPAGAQQPTVVDALDGVDPVLLIQGKEIAGKPELKVVRGRFAYLFSSPETKATFEREPAKYEIQMNGSCARMGPGVGGNPSDFAVVDGKVYIFGSDDCHKKFVAAPARFLPRPVPPMPTAAQDLEQGRALVDRAVKALGGAAALDGVATYVETSTQVQRRANADMPVVTKTTWRFPGAVRSERTMTMQGKEMTSATLIIPAGGWYISQGRSYEQNPISRANNQQEFSRQLVPLLRTRSDPAFKAARVGIGTIDGTPVERVRIQNGVVDVTLGIEPESGRVHSLMFTGRNGEAEIGEYALVFSDYRQVSGLMLPFEVRALFDGTPDSFRSGKIDSITINAPVDGSLFEAPKAEAK